MKIKIPQQSRTIQVTVAENKKETPRHDANPLID